MPLSDNYQSSTEDYHKSTARAVSVEFEPKRKAAGLTATARFFTLPILFFFCFLRFLARV